SVVAPLSAVTTAVIPIAIGLGVGERPSGLAVVGILCAFPAIVLVAGAGAGSESPEPVHPAQVHDFAHVSDAAPAARPHHSGVVDGLLAGAGFGVLFAAAGRIDEAAGLAPTVLMQLAAVVAIAALATVLREAWVPRDPLAWRAVAAGPLAAAAIVLL